MKQLVLLILLTTFLTSQAQESNFKEFYKSHKKEATISFDIPLFLVKSFIDKEDIDKEILNKATNFKMLIYDNKDNTIVNDFKKFSKKNKLKTLIRVKDNGGKAAIYFLEENEFIKEIVLVAGSNNEEVVFMGLKTKKLTKDELIAMIEKHS